MNGRFQAQHQLLRTAGMGAKQPAGGWRSICNGALRMRRYARYRAIGLPCRAAGHRPCVTRRALQVSDEESATLGLSRPDITCALHRRPLCLRPEEAANACSVAQRLHCVDMYLALLEDRLAWPTARISSTSATRVALHPPSHDPDTNLNDRDGVEWR